MDEGEGENLGIFSLNVWEWSWVNQHGEFNPWGSGKFMGFHGDSWGLKQKIGMLMEIPSGNQSFLEKA